MNGQIKVSVCIPVYNAEAYIEQCVRSLFEQTLDSIEYVFIDDCSSDNSIGVMQNILEEYPHRKHQVKIIRHQVNKGVTQSRCDGVASCTGDYIIHCDADDWVDANMYETMYNKAIETDADVVCCNKKIHKKNFYRIVKMPNISTSDEFICRVVSNISFSSLWDKLFRKTIAKSLDLYIPTDIYMREDVIRLVQMLLKCQKIAFVDNPFYNYRLSSNSLTGNVTREKYENVLASTEILGEILLDSRFKKALTALKCLDLLSAVKKTNLLTPFEFHKKVNELDYSDIKAAMKLLTKQERILFLIALHNYRIATVSFQIYKTIKKFL